MGGLDRKLKYLMHCRSLSVRELARRSGVKKRKINKILGGRTPDFRDLAAIVSGMGKAGEI